MGAYDSTLTEAILLLRGRFSDLTDEVLHDRIVVWIGSAVSREKFPPLDKLLLLLFEALQEPRPDQPNLPLSYRVATDCFDDDHHGLRHRGSANELAER